MSRGRRELKVVQLNGQLRCAFCNRLINAVVAKGELSAEVKLVHPQCMSRMDAMSVRLDEIRGQRGKVRG